jgi:hypothetical protein
VPVFHGVLGRLMGAPVHLERGLTCGTHGHSWGRRWA